VFSLFKKSKPKLAGDLYVSVVKDGDPELFLDIDQAALSGLTKEKYVTMRVIVVKPDNPQK
jgi:hypothetical protein